MHQEAEAKPIPGGDKQSYRDGKLMLEETQV